MGTSRLFAALCLAIVSITIDASTTATIVHLKNGPIAGKRRGDYFAFEGIPYAKPPLGKLRFAASELNDDRWTEPRNATARGPVCLQWNHLNPGENKLEGTEDCLFLNVYTRSNDPTARLPTIAFIHGGALMFGTGNFYEPDHIMRRHMILVTFNYRLGPLGFLSTEDDVIPGNFGLKDQIISNRLYFAGVTESAKLMHPFTNVYVYYDLYKSKFGVGEALSHRDEPGLLGVAHGDDVLLIFPSVLREEIPFTEEEMLVVDRFVTMYEHFAKGDQPRFGAYELPLQDSTNKLVFLELNYPQSKTVRAEGVSDEPYWGTLDFNDGPYASPAPTHTEL
uniref:carboxylesterase n=1 Tax=Anopheles merus TaxID=30066 RepID=A0A182V0X6_ANOME